MEDLVKEKEDVPAAAAPEETELDRARREAADYLNGWKRAMADYANLKRETERDRFESAKFASASLVAELLPVYDHFRKALATRPEAPGEPETRKRWMDGIGHIVQRFETALKSVGVVVITETGVPFDPSRHEAMMKETRDGSVPGTVLAVLESGYALHDRILRPAKVTVSE